MTVQYALNTSTIRPASLMEKIRIAGQTGYQGIELWNDDLTAHEQQGGSLADVRQALGRPRVWRCRRLLHSTAGWGLRARRGRRRWRRCGGGWRRP